MRLHLVDGTFELFRAHYGKRPGHIGPDGRDLKATVGVVASLIALLEDAAEQCTHLAVAFDNPIESFRNELFAGYKTGAGMDPALVAQMDEVEHAVRALGVTVWSMDRFEADDALATGARRFGARVEQVRIMTPDKDLGQCLRGQQVVQVDRIRQKVIDEGALRERRGIGPASIPDWLALVGDTADGIPGLPGFGEKAATALLGRFEHIEAIPADTAAWEGVRGATKLAATLAERKDDVLLYRKLATLMDDVPLSEDLEDLCWRGAPRRAYAQWCDRVGIGGSLRSRPSRWDDGG
ncbi:5'-3' exonuclease [Paraliomyxa miuraensis]|uniref:5'-3' exonuclease n=1 Tax=Paraliomyxa miuraensis TaxID=376150 RepID=UPI00224D7BB5|nr:5'-3' exonuclease H3TH domain-containing protein [Paraliomyxa miuraensis]MCX4247347.1 flap endonuclease [Paraliomyxa miuraensis]